MMTSQDQPSRDPLPSVSKKQSILPDIPSCIDMEESNRSIVNHDVDSDRKVGNLPSIADRTSTHGSRTTGTTSTADIKKLNLLSSVSAGQSTCVTRSTLLQPSTNARTITVGDLGSSSMEDLFRGTVASYEFVFPCLSIDIDSSLLLLPQESSSIPALLARPVSVFVENPSTGNLQIQDLLAQSFPASQQLHKVFTSLIHRRLEFWIDTLRRAVSLEEQGCDSNNKRVLAALLDVQSSIYVHSDLKVKFGFNGNSGLVNYQSNSAADTNTDEMMKIEQELADTLKTMRGGCSTTLRAMLTEETQQNTISSKPLSQDIAASLLFPDIGCAETYCQKDQVDPLADDAEDDESRKKVTVPLCLDASAYVSAQIGDELEHNQSVGLQTGGAVTAYYEASSLVRVELTLNTQQLYCRLEKEARSVARSTAESVLLNAVTEQELSGSRTNSSLDQHHAAAVVSVEGMNKGHEQPAPVTPRATYAAPVSPKTCDKGYGVRSLQGAPPIAVSPITITTTPRRNNSNAISTTPPSPIVSIRKLPLVSPPPAKNKRLKLPFQQQNRLSNIHSPYLPVFRTSFSDHLFGGKSIVEDVAGALTALKHSN